MNTEKKFSFDLAFFAVTEIINELLKFLGQIYAAGSDLHFIY